MGLQTCPRCRGKGYYYEGYLCSFCEGRHGGCPNCDWKGYITADEPVWCTCNESDEDYNLRGDYEDYEADYEAEYDLSEDYREGYFENNDPPEDYGEDYEAEYNPHYSEFANRIVRQSRRWGAGEIDYEMAQYIEEQLDVDD